MCGTLSRRGSRRAAFLGGLRRISQVITRFYGTKQKVKRSEYVRYFHQNYVGFTHQGRYVRARFDPHSWNVFARTLNGDPRSNNGTEGWHASLNADYPRSNLPMSQCIIRLQREEEKTRNMMVKYVNITRFKTIFHAPHCKYRGNPADPIRGRSKKESHRETQLAALVKAYDSTPVEERDRLQYLLHVQLHLSESAFARVEAEILLDVENQPPVEDRSEADNASSAAEMLLPTQSQRSQTTPVSSQRSQTTQVSSQASPSPSELAELCCSAAMRRTPSHREHQDHSFLGFDEDDD